MQKRKMQNDCRQRHPFFRCLCEVTGRVWFVAVVVFLGPSEILSQQEDEVVRKVFDSGKVAEVVFALKRGDVDGATKLVENGANINAEGQEGFRPLHLIIGYYYSAEGAILALDLGAKPNVVADRGSTPLFEAVGMAFEEVDMALDVEHERWFDVVKALVSSGAKVDFATEHARIRARSPIVHKVYFVCEKTSPEDLSRLWWLLEHGGDVNEQNRHGQTLLEVTYRRRKFKAAYGLLQRGANPHVKHRGGESFYQWMVRNRKKSMDENKKMWLHKVHANIEGLRDDCALIGEAQEIDKRFQEFLRRYWKSESGRKEAQAIAERRRYFSVLMDALERELEKGEENDTRKKKSKRLRLRLEGLRR